MEGQLLFGVVTFKGRGRTGASPLKQGSSLVKVLEAGEFGVLKKLGECH